MKKLFCALFFIALVFVVYKVSTRENSINYKVVSRLNSHVSEVKKIISSTSKYNKEVAFFIDMKIPSGKNRFFVYDLKENKIIDKGIVAHGSGSETGTAGKLKFSNVPNSLSTSLGDYYIGNHYYGKFGKAYRLYGLDKTNNNAFIRDIVFHYYSRVPYKEKDGYICNSFGCPMVNKKYFERIAQIIDASESNILLRIYY